MRYILLKHFINTARNYNMFKPVGQRNESPGEGCPTRYRTRH